MEANYQDYSKEYQSVRNKAAKHISLKTLNKTQTPAVRKGK